METYYQKNRERILAKRKEEARLARIERAKTEDIRSNATTKFCFPERIKNTDNYKKFYKQYRNEFPIIEPMKSEKRKLELLKQYKITAPTLKCNSKCPYYKECQIETRAIRKAFKTLDND